MGVNFYTDGFSYEYGSIHGTESWLACDIYSDVTGYELDEGDALYIEDIGYCSKKEVIGRESTREEMFEEHKNGERFSYAGNPDCYIKPNPNNNNNLELAQKVESKGRIVYNFEKIENLPKKLYRLDSEDYVKEEPLLLTIDPKEYFKDALDTKKAGTYNLKTICDYSIILTIKEDGSFSILDEFTEKESNNDLSILEEIKIYKDTKENEYIYGDEEGINDYFYEINDFDSQFERDGEAYSSPPDDDYDYYE